MLQKVGKRGRFDFSRNAQKGLPKLPPTREGWSNVHSYRAQRRDLQMSQQERYNGIGQERGDVDSQQQLPPRQRHHTERILPALGGHVGNMDKSKENGRQ